MSEFPTFEIPVSEEWMEQPEATYLPAPLFDFEKGDFVRDGRNRVVMVDGLQAYKNWVHKSLQTQHGACLAYLDIGVDYDGAMSEETPGAVQSELERSITEALLMHPMTERVRDFEFSWDNETLFVSFTVKGKDSPPFDIEMSVV